MAQPNYSIVAKQNSTDWAYIITGTTSGGKQSSSGELSEDEAMAYLKKNFGVPSDIANWRLTAAADDAVKLQRHGTAPPRPSDTK